MNVPAQLDVELIRTTAALEALRPEWDALYASASAGSNPFLRWIWVWHWWRSVARRRTLPHTRLHVLAMRDSQGVLRAIVPFFLGAWQAGPLALRALRLYGFHTTLTDIRTVLVSPGWEVAAAQGLLHALRAQRRLYHLCVLDGLGQGTPFAAEVSRATGGRGHWGPELPAYFLPLPETWEALRARMSRNNRGSVQQGYNALKRDGLTAHLEVIVEPAEVPAALDDLFRLHSARASSLSGPVHKDYYAEPEDRAFVREVAPELALQQLIRICRLRVGGSVVACRIVLSAGNGLYLYHAGHDPAWDRYRVGTVLTAECIQMAIRAGAQALYLGTGADVSKLRWAPRSETFQQLHLAAPAPAGELVTGAVWPLLVIARNLRERWGGERALKLGGWRAPLPLARKAP